MINAKDFARLYAERRGVPNKYAALDCEIFWEVLSEILYVKKESLTIYGLFSLQQNTKAAKKVRHPTTKEMITIPERNTIKFIQTSRVPQE